MDVTFISINDNNRIEYKTTAIQEENVITFMDKSIENTKVIVEIKEDYMNLTRQGDVTMEMCFIPHKLTKGFYQNNLGLSFSFDVFCSFLSISGKKIEVQYEMILEDGTTNKQNLTFIFTN